MNSYELLFQFSTFVIQFLLHVHWWGYNYFMFFHYSENELECILFGEAASEAALSVGDVDATCLVVVLNLARLTWTDDSKFLYSLQDNLQMTDYISNLIPILCKASTL